MHKKPYLDAVADLAGQRGGHIETFHIGNLMYAEAPDIRAGRILDLPLSRSTALRRARTPYRPITNRAALSN